MLHPLDDVRTQSMEAPLGMPEIGLKGWPPDQLHRFMSLPLAPPVHFHARS